MFTLLSPAKKLLSNFKPYSGLSSEPIFKEQTQILVQLMCTKSVAEIAALMDLSQDLAELNFQRYQHFSLPPSVAALAYPALYMFQGDVYQGLQAATWEPKTVEYAQEHLRILSGLYGLLKPLDKIQPYRLEMGVRLENPAGKNLYAFWQAAVTHTLNEQLAVQKNPILLNLASTEYFKVVDEKKLNYPVLTVNFYEKKNQQLKMIGIHAKKARGVMAQFIMQQQIDEVDALKSFNGLGYAYHSATSSEQHLDFVRDSN